MKRKLFKIIPVICLLLYGNTVLANGILQYHISKKKVETSQVIDNKDGYYSVFIKLKEPYKKEFAKFTRKHIGKKLQIIFLNQVLIEPIIRDTIDSGIIQIGRWKSAEEALMFIETLQNSNKKEKFRGHQKTYGVKPSNTN